MSRKYLNEQHMLDLMTMDLKNEFPDTEDDLRFSGILKLAGEDANGCNWSEATFSKGTNYQGDLVGSPEYAFANELVLKYKLLYNVR